MIRAIFSGSTRVPPPATEMDRERDRHPCIGAQRLTPFCGCSSEPVPGLPTRRHSRRGSDTEEREIVRRVDVELDAQHVENIGDHLLQVSGQTHHVIHG